MARTIEARAVISAQDATGGVFDRIAAKIKGVNNAAKSIGNQPALPKWLGNMERDLAKFKLSQKEMMDVTRRQREMYNLIRGEGAHNQMQLGGQWRAQELAHWKKMKGGIDDAVVAHKRWRSAIVAGGSAVAGTAAFAAGGAYGAYRIGKAGIKSAAENQRESARDYLAGLSPDESKRIEDKALEASNRFKSVDSQTMHERLRDTAMSTRSVDKAVEMSDTIGEMTTVLQSLKGKDKAIEEGRKFFTALDVLGKNIDPKEMRELADGFIKAQGVEGADMNLGGVMTMARRMKSAGATVSNRFLYTTGVGLARDMGDDRAGNSLAMMMQQEVQATAKAKEYGQKFGLRDKSGKFTDRSTMMSDPDEWAWKNVTEAMKKAKLDPSKAEDVNTFLQSAYSNSSARDVVSKLMTQREQYEAKGPQFAKAPGLEAGRPGAGGLQQRDPFVAYESVFSQLRTLSGQAPIMDAAASGLNSFSDAIVNLNKTIKSGEVPLDSRGGRLLRYLQQKGVRTGTNYYPQGEDPMGSGAEGIKVPPSSPYPVGGDPMGASGSGWDRSRYSAGYWGGLGREEATAAGAARIRREAEARNGYSAPGLTQSMTWGTGVQNQSNVEKSANVQVEGEVKGEMEGTFKFVVDSSGLVSAVDEMKRLSADIAGKLRTIGGNGPGSTGRSSPDAQAPGGTGYGGRDF